MNRKEHGVTITELLIACGILAIVLGIITAFLTSEARATRLTQGRNEVQDKARFVTQALIQDLHLAGSARYVTSANNVVKLSDSVFAPCTGSNYCLTVPSGVNASGTRDAFRTRYITSLRPQAEACRHVEYGWDGSTLRRSDVACGATLNAAELASHIVALDIQYTCSNAAPGAALKNTAIECLGSNPASPVAYPRSARVTVYAASEHPYHGASGASYTLPDGTTVNCPVNHLCYGISQEVMLPNLKDK